MGSCTGVGIHSPCTGLKKDDRCSRDGIILEDDPAWDKRCLGRQNGGKA